MSNELEQYLAQFGTLRAIPLTKFQKVFARRLAESWTGIPHVTHNYLIDVTALENTDRAFRDRIACHPWRSWSRRWRQR